MGFDTLYIQNNDNTKSSYIRYSPLFVAGISRGINNIEYHKTSGETELIKSMNLYDWYYNLNNKVMEWVNS